MTNVEFYTDYFRQLAVRHKDLKHNPAAETGDADVSEKRFTKWSVEEVVTGLRGSMGFPALMLELYDEKGTSEMMYSVAQHTRGAFTILAQSVIGDFNSEIAAYAIAERIMFDMLKQIWQDHYADEDACDTPFKSFSFNYEKTPVGPLFEGNKFGYRVEFDFQFHNHINFTTPPEDGTFTDA